MALIITTNSGEINKYVQEYFVDNVADISTLPIDIHPGSKATVVTTGDIYILNSNYEWNKLN
jgi:hypothetical protein